MKKEVIRKKRLDGVLELRPDIRIREYLQSGEFGDAYVVENDSVLKITNDQREFHTARILKGKELKHIVYIHDCWDYKCVYDDDNSDSLYCIEQEYINTEIDNKTIDLFVSVFRSGWFSDYFPNVENRYGNNQDLDIYMKNPEKHSKAISYVKRLVSGYEMNIHTGLSFENIFNQLSAAYIELRQHAPESCIDLNSGNIGFTSDGILKVFDIQ